MLLSSSRTVSETWVIGYAMPLTGDGPGSAPGCGYTWAGLTKSMACPLPDSMRQPNRYSVSR